jgi:hypothetical protein
MIVTSGTTPTDPVPIASGRSMSDVAIYLQLATIPQESSPYSLWLASEIEGERYRPLSFV